MKILSIIRYSAHILSMLVDLKHSGRSRSLPRMPLWPRCFPAPGQAVSLPHISRVRLAKLRGHGWTIYCLHVSPGLCSLPLVTVREKD